MSAVTASPTLGVEDDLDAVRALQHALYRAAKADPGRRFHALYDKVHRRDVMWRAWGQVRRNNGAPGIEDVPSSVEFRWRPDDHQAAETASV